MKLFFIISRSGLAPLGAVSFTEGKTSICKGFMVKGSKREVVIIVAP